MNKVIVYPDPPRGEKGEPDYWPGAEGGIAIFLPAEKSRRRIVIKEAVYREAFQTAEVATGETDDEGQPVFETRRLPLPAVLVEPEESRPETDGEFLARLAARAVPQGLDYDILPQEEAYAKYRPERKPA